MINEHYPSRPPSPDTRSGCLRTAAITCILLLVIGIVMAIVMVIYFTKNPTVRKAYREAQLRVQCEQNMKEIGGAIERFYKRNGRYPTELGELYPNFIENRELLHCPAGSGPQFDYDYTQPDVNAPDDMIIVECRRHVVFENQPPWLVSLQKDGQVVQHGYSPRGGPPEPDVGD